MPHKGRILDSKDGYKVIDCKQCGFAHVLPLPSRAELAAMYRNEYYSKDRPNYFADAERDLKWWDLTYKMYYKVFAEHLQPKLPQKKKLSLLDIGSGPGYFLASGDEMNWNTLGIEPSKHAYLYSKKLGVKVVNKIFDKRTANKLGKFDVVHASMVLEHIPNPIEFIKNAINCVKPGGLLAIFCPNDFNPLQEILKDQGMPRWWIVPKHHINYFSVQSMSRLLDSLGLTVVDSLMTFPLEFFILSGDNYVGNPELGKICHMKRKKFEMSIMESNPGLLIDLYRNNAANEIGREFMIIAKRHEED